MSHHHHKRRGTSGKHRKKGLGYHLKAAFSVVGITEHPDETAKRERQLLYDQEHEGQRSTLRGQSVAPTPKKLTPVPYKWGATPQLTEYPPPDFSQDRNHRDLFLQAALATELAYLNSGRPPYHDAHAVLLWNNVQNPDICEEYHKKLEESGQGSISRDDLDAILAKIGLPKLELTTELTPESATALIGKPRLIVYGFDLVGCPYNTFKLISYLNSEMAFKPVRFEIFLTCRDPEETLNPYQHLHLGDVRTLEKALKHYNHSKLTIPNTS